MFTSSRFTTLYICTLHRDEEKCMPVAELRTECRQCEQRWLGEHAARACFFSCFLESADDCYGTCAIWQRVRLPRGVLALFSIFSFPVLASLWSVYKSVVCAFEVGGDGRLVETGGMPSVF